MLKLKYGNKKYLSLLSIALLVSSALAGAILYSMRFLTDFAMEGNVSGLLDISKFMFLIILFQLGMNFILSWVKAQFLEKSMNELRSIYISRLFNLDILNLSSGENNIYLSQLSNDMDRYEQKFYLNLIDLLGISMELLVSLIILASFHILLFLIATALFAFFIIFANKTSKPVEEKEQNKSKSLQEYTQYVEESLDGFLEVKQNQLEVQRQDQFSSLATKVQEDNYELDKKTSQIDAMNSLVQMLILFSLIIVGLLAAKYFNLSLGTTLVAGTAFANSTWPMQRVSPLISEMRGSSVILKDFDTTLKTQIKDGNKTLLNIKTIEFSNASFAYDNHLILEDVNLSIEKSEKILIVGESGAGKSTLLKGLRRQLQPIKGRIDINEFPIDDYLAHDYFKEISVVDQIGFIFNGTVLENITLYDEFNKDELHELIKQVGLNNLKLNDSLRNNGSNISGGQRARLLLARALFKDKSLIICDEIFANLDASIAKNIEHDLLSINTTVINVSHIIFEENIELYDKIYLVENGHVKLIDRQKALRQQL